MVVDIKYPFHRCSSVRCHVFLQLLIRQSASRLYLVRTALSLSYLPLVVSSWFSILIRHQIFQSSTPCRRSRWHGGGHVVVPTHYVRTASVIQRGQQRREQEGGRGRREAGGGIEQEASEVREAQQVLVKTQTSDIQSDTRELSRLSDSGALKYLLQENKQIDWQTLVSHKIWCCSRIKKWGRIKII